MDKTKLLLPLAVLLVALAFFLPKELSGWRDQTLLNTLHLEEDPDRTNFPDSVGLTIADKLFLLRAGLSALPVVDEGTGTHIAISEGKVTVYESEQPLPEGRDDLDREEKTQKWAQRLKEVQGELQGLYRLGALPKICGADSTLTLNSGSEILYIDSETQVSFVVYYMDITCSSCGVNVAVDAQTGKLLSGTLRWSIGTAPSWGLTGAANFGNAWRDYWGMDEVDTGWSASHTQRLLEEAEAVSQAGNTYAASTEVAFTYNEQTLRVPLYCWQTGSRTFSMQWNTF